MNSCDYCAGGSCLKPWPKSKLAKHVLPLDCCSCQSMCGMPLWTINGILFTRRKSTVKRSCFVPDLRTARATLAHLAFGFRWTTAIISRLLMVSSIQSCWIGPYLLRPARVGLTSLVRSTLNDFISCGGCLPTLFQILLCIYTGLRPDV